MKVVSILNMKGGVAKTTLCVNLGAYYNLIDKRVLIVDIDPQFNATQALISGASYSKRVQNGDHTIYDIFDDNVRPAVSTVSGVQHRKPTSLSEIQPWKLYTSRKGSGKLDIIPGNLELYRLEMASGSGRENRLKLFIQSLEKNDAYDIVLIDTPPTPSAWMTSSLIASNYYLIPVKPEPLSAVGIDLLRGVISSKQTNYGLDIDCAGLVLTMAEKRTQVFQETQTFLRKNEFWKDKLYESYLPKRIEIAKLQGQQKTVWSSKDNRLIYSIMNIGNELLRRISL